jgi:predicted dehydrogenase
LTLRVGLAGAGWVTQHHLAAWSALSERARVVAIADPREEAARARATKYGIPAVFSSVETMLEQVQLDVIDIAAPREFHVPICRMAAQRGLAILCQKPLAPTLQEAEALVRELGADVRLMVHENWRFRPHYRQIREWLDEGHIGEIRTVAASILTSGLLPDATGVAPALVRQPMLAQLERMLLMEVMIHHVDTLRFLLGPLQLQSAQLGKSSQQIRGEDRAALLLRGRNGAAVSLVGDFMAFGYPAEQKDRLEILGSKGAILLRDDELVLTGTMEKRQKLDLAANYEESYRAAIEHFLDRLADGGTFETSAEDNLQTLRIVEAAYHVS